MKTLWHGAAALMTIAVSTGAASAQFYPGYYPYYGNFYNPYSGNLYGAASVINAQGQLMLDTQKTYMQKEKILQEKQVTRRKAIDEYLYEQSVLPTPEEKRERSRQEQLQRSRNDPPLTEIWSGKALNDLLLDIQRLSAAPAYVPSMPIDPTMLQHINISTGRTEGSVGILDNLENLQWPFALTDSTYDKDRAAVEKLSKEAVNQASTMNRVDPTTLRSLIQSVDNMVNRLRNNIANTPSTQYVSAKRFLTELQNATKVLQQPNVASYFSNWKLRGNTIAEVVDFMTAKGLKFAPASAGDESYYTALQRQLSNYDIALSHQNSSASLFQQGNMRAMLQSSPGGSPMPNFPSPNQQPPFPKPPLPKPPLPKPPLPGSN
ncbi:MAG: hypothetical protein AB7K24_09020 [Gemmataceae bacterium]